MKLILDFRRTLSIIVNFLTVIWILKVCLFDKNSDMIGIYMITILLFLFFYNIYLYVFYKITSFFKNTLVRNSVYLIFLLFPFFLLYKLST